MHLIRLFVRICDRKDVIKIKRHCHILHFPSCAHFPNGLQKIANGCPPQNCITKMIINMSLMCQKFQLRRVATRPTVFQSCPEETHDSSVSSNWFRSYRLSYRSQLILRRLFGGHWTFTGHGAGPQITRFDKGPILFLKCNFCPCRKILPTFGSTTNQRRLVQLMTPEWS